MMKLIFQIIIKKTNKKTQKKILKNINTNKNKTNMNSLNPNKNLRYNDIIKKYKKMNLIIITQI